MTAVTRAGTIVAAPGVVWEALADFGAIVTWAPNVDHSCLLTDHQVGVGAARRVQAGRTTLVETVTEWTPPTADRPGELTYTLAGLPKVVRTVSNSWRLEPDGARTAVTLTSTVDAGPRPPQRLIARILARKLAAASDQMIAGLTAHVSQRELRTPADPPSHPPADPPPTPEVSP